MVNRRFSGMVAIVSAIAFVFLAFSPQAAADSDPIVCLYAPLLDPSRSSGNGPFPSESPKLDPQDPVASAQLLGAHAVETVEAAEEEAAYQVAAGQGCIGGVTGGLMEGRVDGMAGSLGGMTCQGEWKLVHETDAADVFLHLLNPIAVLVLAVAIVTLVVVLYGVVQDYVDGFDYHYTWECTGLGFQVTGTGSGGISRRFSLHNNLGDNLADCEYTGVADVAALDDLPVGVGVAAGTKCTATWDVSVAPWTATGSDIRRTLPEKVDACIHPEIYARNAPQFDPVGVMGTDEKTFKYYNPDGVCRKGVKVDWTRVFDEE